MPQITDDTATKKRGSRKKSSKDLGEKVQAHQRYTVTLTDADGETKEVQVPGVTTVLGLLNKPALVPWANRMGLKGIDTSKYVDEAATIGSVAHYLILCDAKGMEPDLADFTETQIERAQYGFNAYLQWKSEHRIEGPELIEQPMTMKLTIPGMPGEYGVGGTIDRLITLDGTPTLLDMKTTSSLWPEHGYQVSAYFYMARANGYDVRGARILRIGRTEDEGWDEQRLNGAQVLRGWKIFQHLLAVYNLRKDAKG
jgi:hypothetical protein